MRCFCFKACPIGDHVYFTNIGSWGRDERVLSQQRDREDLGEQRSSRKTGMQGIQKAQPLVCSSRYRVGKGQPSVSSGSSAGSHSPEHEPFCSSPAHKWQSHCVSCVPREVRNIPVFHVHPRRLGADRKLGQRHLLLEEREAAAEKWGDTGHGAVSIKV